MRVIETTPDEDLSSFSRFLRDRRVPHRVFEERGRLILEVGSAQLAEPVVQAYRQWQAGSLDFQAELATPQSTGAWQFGLNWRAVARFPVLAGTLAIALLVYPFSTSSGETSISPL